MSELENALDRVGDALARLEAAVDKQNKGEDIWGEVSTEMPAVMAERDKLADEVAKLRSRADEDKVLRAEAADAVRQALTDLRGAVGQGVSANA